MSESSENRRRVANFFEQAKDEVIPNVLVKLDNSGTTLIEFIYLYFSVCSNCEN
jgi:hypothetical protein